MVTPCWPEFTINVICHDDVELLRRTLPHNVAQLCDGSARSCDLVLTVDGAETAPRAALLEIAEACGIDEVRLRRRRRSRAAGDGSNNGHAHAFSDKTRYLVTLESDIAFFRTDPAFDPLDAFARFFERHPGRPLLHRMDDHDCWVWKLEKIAPDIEPGVWSVNRVSSHFLVYNTAAARQVRGYPDLDGYRDGPSAYHNFEDEVSHRFAEPAGPAIAFPAGWPIRVYHCDRKIHPGSAHYSKSTEIKLQVLAQRSAEIASLMDRPVR
jgi:hypothetical protein